MNADATRDSGTRRLRRLYDLILDSAGEGIFGLDAEGRITFINPAGARMLGFEASELIGRFLHSMIHHSRADGTSYPSEDCPIYRAFRDGGVHHSDPNEVFWRKDGKSIPVEFTSTPIHEGERLSGTVVVFEDVTERRRLEQQFVQAQKMESVGRLAGGIAHDFNNLLLVINGYSELLLSQLALGDPNRASVEQILEAGRRAAGLTRQILAFSRRQPFEAVPVDLNELLGATEKMLQRLIGENIRLDIRAAREPVVVKADPGQIEQVVMNLAVNARDAMPEGGTLTLAACTENDPGGPHATLTVTDTGCGMSRETLSHLFEPFFTTKPQGEGTGLGLSTVYGIVQRSGGQVTASSELGRGSTFKIRLPLFHEVGPKDATVPTAEAVSRGREVVLLVEDEAPVRTLLAGVLRTAGYTVRDIGEPLEALKILEGQDPVHLLVTDSVMPDLSGPELARRAVPLRSGLRVLFISGYSDRAVGENLSPGQAFLQKPFATETFREKVRALLDAPR